MVRAAKATARGSGRAVSLVDQLNGVEDLIELAHLAADAGDFGAANWMDKFAKRLAQHGRLTSRQMEVIADVREKYEGDVADMWLRPWLARRG